MIRRAEDREIPIRRALRRNFWPHARIIGRQGAVLQIGPVLADGGVEAVAIEMGDGEIEKLRVGKRARRAAGGAAAGAVAGGGPAGAVRPACRR